MKRLHLAIVTALVLLSPAVFSQRVRLMEGDIGPAKADRSINLQYAYDNMRVGKFDKESEYVSNKTDEYNKKESGKGDQWAKTWVADRKNRYEPKFQETFFRYSDMTQGDGKAKYTLIFKTSFTEPGYNIGIMNKAAYIDGEAWIVETANPNNVIAKISVTRAPGRSFYGADFDTGERISEAYAQAGRAVGAFMRH
jgi:hypothetical protein